MQVTGEIVMKGRRSQIWALLNDEAVLARCLPGCERLVREGPDRFAVALKVGLAGVKGSYEGSLTMTDKREPESVTLKIESNGGGGFAHVSGGIELFEQGESTRVAYDWQVQVGGSVAMVGQRVLGGVARWLIGEFFHTAEKELQTGRDGSCETPTV